MCAKRENHRVSMHHRTNSTLQIPPLQPKKTKVPITVASCCAAQASVRTVLYGNITTLYLDGCAVSRPIIPSVVVVPKKEQEVAIEYDGHHAQQRHKLPYASASAADVPKLSRRWLRQPHNDSTTVSPSYIPIFLYVHRYVLHVVVFCFLQLVGTHGQTRDQRLEVLVLTRKKTGHIEASAILHSFGSRCTPQVATVGQLSY